MTEKEKYVVEHYEITEDGRVFSTLISNNNYQRKELKQRLDPEGYYDVALVYNDRGRRMPFRVNRLVALAHIPNPDNLPIVNHKDLDKQNNNKSNLEWLSVASNTQHGYDNCAYSNVKKVKVVEKDGNIKVFPSVSATYRHYDYANPSTLFKFFKDLEGVNLIRGGKLKDFTIEYTNEEVTHIN